MLDIKTENTGARLVINPAPYKLVLNLKKHILNEILKHPLGLKLKNGGDTVLDKELDFTDVIDFLKNTLISLDISDDLNNALFDCLKYCTWNSHKITMELFDDQPDIREDNYEIIVKCIEENLRPFIKSLVSQWKMFASIMGESQALPAILAQMNS